MDCPHCGYVMVAGETECRRCRWRPGEPAAAPSPSAPMPSAPPPARPVPARPGVRAPQRPQPPSIVVAVVVTIVLMTLAILGGLLGLCLIPLVAETFGERLGRPEYAWLALILLVWVLLAAGVIAVSFFLWHGRNWARWVLNVVAGIKILFSLASLVAGSLGAVVGAAVWGVVLYFLNTSASREYCSPERRLGAHRGGR